jgi:hypothetical protein
VSDWRRKRTKAVRSGVASSRATEAAKARALRKRLGERDVGKIIPRANKALNIASGGQAFSPLADG